MPRQIPIESFILPSGPPNTVLAEHVSVTDPKEGFSLDLQLSRSDYSNRKTLMMGINII